MANRPTPSGEFESGSLRRIIHGQRRRLLLARPSPTSRIPPERGAETSPAHGGNRPQGRRPCRPERGRDHLRWLRSRAPPPLLGCASDTQRSRSRGCGERPAAVPAPGLGARARYRCRASRSVHLRPVAQRRQRRDRLMVTKTSTNGARNVGSEIAYLTGALKAPTLAVAVDRLAERPAPRTGATRSSSPRVCSARSPPAKPTAARDASAPPASRPGVVGGVRPAFAEARRHHPSGRSIR